ncbi:MAG: hypothetical protein ACK5M3_00215 [Dysgonomonas sp.]
MKKILLTTSFILICISMTAQMPMGGGGRPQGGRPGGGERPPMQNGNSNSGGQDFILMSMPDIPGLTLEQREKLSKAISDERKDMSKLMDEKQELRMKSDNPGLAEKKRQKLMEKMIKADNKIKKNEEKYDKKFRSILTEEQYQFFMKKKKDIEFKGFGKPNNQQRPPRRPDNGERPDMPDENMFQ